MQNWGIFDLVNGIAPLSIKHYTSGDDLSNGCVRDERPTVDAWFSMLIVSFKDIGIPKSGGKNDY